MFQVEFAVPIVQSTHALDSIFNVVRNVYFIISDYILRQFYDLFISQIKLMENAKALAPSVDIIIKIAVILENFILFFQIILI